MSAGHYKSMIFRYRIVVSNSNHRAVFFDYPLLYHVTAKRAGVRIGGQILHYPASCPERVDPVPMQVFLGGPEPVLGGRENVSFRKRQGGPLLPVLIGP